MARTSSRTILKEKFVTPQSEPSEHPVSEPKKTFTLPRFTFKELPIKSWTPILVSLLVISAFAIGSLYTQVSMLKAGSGSLPAQAGTPTLAGQPVPSVPPAPVDVENGNLPPLGDTNAPVTIVEFSDFQCPFCERFFTDAYPQIKKDYIDTGKAVLYFRHLPLDFHQAARPAALASECANEQGKFWAYHDIVFSNQSKIASGTLDANTQTLKDFAAQIGLNTTQFNSCLESEKFKANVDKDTADAAAVGANGTPTFFINGTILVGAQPYANFKAAIDQALAQ